MFHGTGGFRYTGIPLFFLPIDKLSRTWYNKYTMNKIKQTPAQGINIIENGTEAMEEIEAACNHLNKIFQEEIDREQLKDTAQVERAKIS